jgi:hypothetical protein
MRMTKAYDLKSLGERVVAKAKENGVEIAAEIVLEALAKSVYFATKEWLKESAELSESKVDDFIAPFYDKLDAFVLDQVAKIDLDKDGQ